MKMNSFSLKMNDGCEIFLNRWEPDNPEDIKGVVQLHHGLAEHSMRYDRLGSILAENGYVLAQIAIEYNDKVIYPDKVRLNCYYYHHYSFWKEIEMIFATVLGFKVKFAGEEV